LGRSTESLARQMPHLPQCSYGQGIGTQNYKQRIVSLHKEFDKCCNVQG